MPALKAEDTLDRRVWGPWATAGFGAVVFIIFLVTQTLVAVIYAAIRYFSDPTIRPYQLLVSLESDGLLVALVTFTSAIICTGVIVGIVKLRKNAVITEYLGFNHITRKTIFILLAVSVVFIILADSLSLILGRPLNPEFLVDTYSTSVWPAFFWIAAIIFAPAFEETFFRGFLFTGFRQSRLGITGTIVLTALIWAVIHMQYGLYEIATIFVLGIVLGIARFKTDSLWSPLLMHAFVNLVATLEVAININSLVG